MCPECGIRMIVFELEGIEIDRCASCRGTWLDAGELERILARASAPAGELSPAARDAGSRRGARRRCPRCRRRMGLVRAGPGDGIEIDRCPRGCGLWFDHGEMETLVRSSMSGDAGAAARFFEGLYGHELSTRGGS